MTEFLKCVSCSKRYNSSDIRYSCECGALLALERDEWPSVTRDTLDARRQTAKGADASGVWMFREFVLNIPENEIVSHPEGRTRLYERASLSAWAGIASLRFKHEGENPTGSFKDRGMTVAITQAKRLGSKLVACASTGNTSSSLAAYAAQAGLKAVVFLPDGKISSGKLAQTLAYGAHGLAIRGDFDAALRLAREAAEKSGVYLVNSVNPFRIEGQKTIIWELLQDLDWTPPDWIVVPAGNLGNVSAFGKALAEAHAAGWITRLPRIAAIQAAGANPFYQSFKKGFAEQVRVSAKTIATAIQIGDPVNYERAKVSITRTNGVVAEVSDEDLMIAKGHIDRSGIGCEPASACTLAGLRQLALAGTIGKNESAVCILTGNILKDPDVLMSEAFGKENRSRIESIDDSFASVARALEALS